MADHPLPPARSPPSTLPQLQDRTLTLSSAGKTFSMTGWKVGFVVAAPELLKVLAKAHQYITFTTPPNLQAAVAYGLGKPAAHFDAMRGDQTLFKHRIEVEGAWNAVMPFLDARSAPLREGIVGNYAQGSWGPRAAHDLMLRDARAWHDG